MTGRTTSKLGDVARFVRGITFKPDDLVPLLSDGAVACMRTKNVQSEIDLNDVWGVPKNFVKRSEQFLNEGDILVSTANSWNLVGKCCWVPELQWPATLGGFISALRADTRKIDPRFLYHWLATDITQARVRSCARQTTNIANLSIPQCLEIEISLPLLEEQQRISAILDQADELRGKRQRALDRLSQLGNAIFIEMFGDPVQNPFDLPVRRLGDVGSLDRGVSKHRPRNDPALLGGVHPLIQTGDVANADGYIRHFSSTYSDLGLRQSRKWPVGTLCITIAANIGKTAILGIEACFPDSVVGFSPGSSTNAEYVQHWMGRIQKRLEEIAPQSAQKNINLAILRALPIPVPPVDDQKKFALRIQALEAQKESLRRARDEADLLFASLQNHALGGEQQQCAVT